MPIFAGMMILNVNPSVPSTLGDPPVEFARVDPITGKRSILDPDNVVKLPYEPQKNYGKNAFFGNAAGYLGNIRGRESDIPRQLDAIQLEFLRQMREHHFENIEKKRGVKPKIFNREKHTFNTRSFLA
jgi:hypothetical protein